MAEHDNHQDRRSRSGFPLSTLVAVFLLGTVITDQPWNATTPSRWVYAGAWLGMAFIIYAKPDRLIAEGGRFEVIHLPLRRGIQPNVYYTVAALTFIFMIGGLVLQFGLGM